MQLRFFLLAIQVVNIHCSLKLPSYLKPCSLSDPNLDECCLKHGKEALPYLVKGDRKYNIPNLSPLFLPMLSVQASNALHVTMTDIYAYGLERADLKRIRQFFYILFNVENKKVSVTLFIDNLQLIGKYDMNGKILILPIQGNGDFNITTVNGVYRYNFEYTLTRKNNEDHMVVKDNDVMTFELEDAFIVLDNLFHGDEVLGEHFILFYKNAFNSADVRYPRNFLKLSQNF
ncbi:hypothetical protein NQ315_008698 [Exocentrus adspersus]|uniref:Uncharacterized protein n=1 Tax=Exocentrus adspersus TaxID=1586481 RepID=A0AAV8W7E9_9CUCU|nr:hypothetical protein NQ315_008698 [Exocentrus adspersus]